MAQDWIRKLVELRRLARRDARTGAPSQPQAQSWPTPDVLAGMSQGCVFSHIESLPVLTGAGGTAVDRVATPNGIVLISQTCDIVQPLDSRPTVQAAALVQLDEVMARESRDQRRPRFVYVPALGDRFFADLQVIATLHKSALSAQFLIGCRNDMEARVFGYAVGRRFSRFPFPDEVSDQIAGLVESIRARYSKESSPLAKVLRRLVEIRLEASTTWTDPNTEVQLIVVCEPGALPSFDEPPELAEGHAKRLKLDTGLDSELSPSQIAEAIESYHKAGDAVGLYFAWSALVQKWAAQCSAVSPSHGTGRAHGFVAELVDAAEFPLTRVRTSEILDVDYLSTPSGGQATVRT